MVRGWSEVVRRVVRGWSGVGAGWSGGGVESSRWGGAAVSLRGVAHGGRVGVVDAHDADARQLFGLEARRGRVAAASTGPKG